MQKIWLLIENQSTFVYVIAGLCFFGVFTKLLLQGKLHRLLKASENMSSTKERQIRTIRNHYENNLNMDLQVHRIRAFIEKYILKLKYGGIPIRIWDAVALEAAMLSVAAGGIGIINAIHRNYGEQVIAEILVATILSCAVLLTIENLFRIENFYERIEANMEDYLENNLRNRLGRPLVSRQERSQRQRDQLVAVASEITNQGMKQEGRVNHTQTDTEGRGNPRPHRNKSVKGTEDGVNENYKYEDIPEYEIRRKATRNFDKEFNQSQESAGHIRESGQEEAAVGEEDPANDAAVVAEVLRNFFSG